jgi:hypothetical protein
MRRTLWIWFEEFVAPPAAHAPFGFLLPFSPPVIRDVFGLAPDRFNVGVDVYETLEGVQGLPTTATLHNPQFGIDLHLLVFTITIRFPLASQLGCVGFRLGWRVGYESKFELLSHIDPSPPTGAGQFPRRSSCAQGASRWFSK